MITILGWYLDLGDLHVPLFLVSFLKFLWTVLTDWNTDTAGLTSKFYGLLDYRLYFYVYFEIFHLSFW